MEKVKSLGPSPEVGALDNSHGAQARGRLADRAPSLFCWSPAGATERRSLAPAGLQKEKRCVRTPLSTGSRRVATFNRACGTLANLPAAARESRRAPGSRGTSNDPRAAGHERRAASHERRSANPGFRIPVPGRWPPSAILAVPSPLESKKPRASSRERRATSHEPARLWRVFCSPLPVPGPWPMTNDKGPMTVVPTLPFRNKLCTTAYAQSSM